MQRIKAATGIKAFLVLPVTALHLAVVVRRIGTDEFMPDAGIGSSSFKQGRQITLTVGKTVGELKAVVGLDAFHADAPAGIPLPQLFQEVGGRVGRLFRGGSQEAQTGKLINGGVLEQTRFRLCDALERNCFSHPLGPTERDRSSAHRAWVCKSFSFWSVRTGPSA